MVIALKLPDDDQPRRQPVRTGPYMQTDDGQMVDSTEYPHCPHCGNQQLADGMSEHNLNQCSHCRQWFFMRREFVTVYLTCTRRRHLLN